MALSSMALATTSLVLRLFSLLFLAASVVVMVANNVTDFAGFYDIDGTKNQFTDHITYRYVVAVGSIGALYALIQIPFGVYHLCTGKRWIRNGCLPIYDFYCDMVISFLLATASGAGFALTYELRTYVGDGLEGFGQTRKYLDIVYKIQVKAAFLVKVSTLHQAALRLNIIVNFVNEWSLRCRNETYNDHEEEDII
ncbi:CASP-like protein 4D1 [Apium graveolens]|uniref:CASP-like protein 4D1 n=1 Tax=Apium graveolens TaxID=4045 RepID=UPI003D7B09DA